MEKTLFIHIGCPGTGIPTLHRYFSWNRAALKKRGFLYPGTPEQHRNTGDDGKNYGMPGAGRNTRNMLQGLIDEMQCTGWHTCFISRENPAGDGDAAVFRELVPKDIAVKVIYYAIRQDELTESLYRHSVESPASRYDGKLDDDLVNSLTGQLDHAAVLRPWAEMFGTENIILRCYERGQMNGGILQDISDVIGLRPDGSLRVPGEHDGKTLSMYQTEFLRLCNSRLKERPDIHHFLLSEFRRSRFTARQPGQHLLSPARRREILARFEDQNNMVARHYLQRADGRLFFEDWPAPDEPWEPFPGLTVEELAPIAMELLYEQQGRWERPRQPLWIVSGFAAGTLKKVTGTAPSGHRGTACRDASWTGNSGPACKAPQGPPSASTVDELVPAIAERIYCMNQRFQEFQPLGSVLVMVNQLLARAIARVPPRKQIRIYRVLRGEWFEDG